MTASPWPSPRKLLSPVARGTFLLAVVTALGCVPDGETPLAPLCPSASVSVSAGAPPVFRWGPCGVSVLQVSAASNRADIKWSIATPDQLPDILAPVTYGQAPAGVTEAGPAAALVPGAEYRMNLLVFVDGVASTTASVRFRQP